MELMQAGVRRVVAELYRAGRIDGALCLAGPRGP